MVVEPSLPVSTLHLHLHEFLQYDKEIPVLLYDSRKVIH